MTKATFVRSHARATVVGLALALSAGIATAQPTPAPTPKPTPPSGPTDGPTAPPPKKELPKTEERAGSDESLQHGTQEGVQDSRPWAAGVPPEKQKSALQHFQAGNKELNKGLFENAVKAYRLALKDWEHPAIHYNLALALLKLNQPLEVYDSLNKAIAFGPEPLEKDKFEHAQEYLALVSQQIATIEITCKKPGAKVSVDGKEVFTVNEQGTNGFYKSRVLVGPHTFVAEKPGFNAEFESPYIGPGEPFRIELKLYTAEELTRYKRRWKQKWMPYAVIGGGVALAGFGVAMSISANSSYDEFDAAVLRCNEQSGGAGCNADEVKDMRDSGDTKKVLSYVGYGAAGAAVIAGVALLYLNREQSYQITADEYKKELRAKNKKAQQVRLTPMIAPDVAGAMFTGSF